MLRRALCFLTVVCGCSREEPRPLEVTDAPASATPACDTRVIATHVQGNWTGSGSEPMAFRPSLAIADATGNPQGAVASISLDEVPFIAADLAGPADLCSDEAGAAPGTIAVRCVSAGVIRRLVVRTSGDALEVIVDGAAPTLWRMPGVAHGCYELHGLGVVRDLEPLRAAWGRDEPRAACRGAKPHAPVSLALRFPVVAANYVCAAATSVSDAGPSSGAVDATRVQLILGTTTHDLGVLHEQCAGFFVTRFDDADAVSFGTTDLGVERRFAYRLGDRLYFSNDIGGVSSAELPCAAAATFAFGNRLTGTEHAKIRTK